MIINFLKEISDKKNKKEKTKIKKKSNRDFSPTSKMLINLKTSFTIINNFNTALIVLIIIF